MTVRRSTAYENIHPIAVTLTLCVATFFVGAYVGAEKMGNELMPMLDDDGWDLAAQINGGTIPLAEALALCALALVFLLALRLVLQVVRASEE